MARCAARGAAQAHGLSEPDWPALAGARYLFHRLGRGQRYHRPGDRGWPYRRVPCRRRGRSPGRGRGGRRPGRRRVRHECAYAC
ncbi:MAG: hypothetical protein EX272_10395 [Chromatiales bacterium]|nr:MAG: hypothetical protein EX272_10395 [Chromatiales bacterium]